MEQIKLRGAIEGEVVEARKREAVRDIDEHPLYVQLQERLTRATEELKRLRDNRSEYTFNEYSETRLAAQNEIHELGDRLGNSVMGLSGEVGEIAEHLKKWFFHGKEMNKEYLLKELGDVLWYVMYMSDALGFTLEQVAKANDKKLAERYPNGFSIKAARNVKSSKE